jgi:hypothetical protein
MHIPKNWFKNPFYIGLIITALPILVYAQKAANWTDFVTDSNWLDKMREISATDFKTASEMQLLRNCDDLKLLYDQADTLTMGLVSTFGLEQNWDALYKKTGDNNYKKERDRWWGILYSNLDALDSKYEGDPDSMTVEEKLNYLSFKKRLHLKFN